MNFRTTIFLVVLLVLFGGFFAVLQWKNKGAATPPGRPNAPAEGRPVFPHPAAKAQDLTADVASVTVQRGDQTLEFERRGTDNWWLTRPVRLPLNGWSAKDVAEQALALAYVERFKPGLQDAPTLAQLSLDPPRAVVTIRPSSSASATRVVKLGKTSVGGRAYAMVEMIDRDPYVYVVNDRLHKTVLDADFKDWRKRGIEAPALGAARQLTLASPTQTISVVKSDGQWSFVPPHAGRAGAESVAGLINALGSVYASRFVADNPPDLGLYGLDKPTAVVSVEESPTPADTQPTSAPASAPAPVLSRLTIGSPTDFARDKYFALWTSKDRPDAVVFEVAKSDVDRYLSPKVDELRDARLTVVRRDDLRELEVRPAAEGGFKLAWTPKGWTFGEPGPGFALDAGAAAKLLDALFDARAKSYVTPAPTGGRPAWTLSLQAIGRSETEIIRLDPHTPPTTQPATAPATQPADWLAVRGNESVGYVVPAAALEPFMQPLIALRDRSVWELKPDQITALRIGQPHAPTGYVLERSAPAASAPATAPATQAAATQPAASPGPWKLTLDGHEADPEASAVQVALAALAHLTCDSWLPTPWSPPAGGLLSAEVTTADGQKRELLIGLDNRHATVAGTSDSFVVSPDLVETLSAEFRQRTLLAVPAADIKEVVVTRGDATLTVSRKDGGTYVAAEGKPLDQVAAAAVYDHLAGLRVERYLPSRQAPPAEVTIALTTRDGRKFHLALVADPKEPRACFYSGDFGQGVARLPPETLEKLKADLHATPLDEPK